MKISKYKIKKLISEAWTTLKDEKNPHSWGALNMHLHKFGHRYFVSNTTPGDFKNQSKQIETMEKKEVWFPLIDKNTKKPILKSDGSPVLRRGFKDVKSIANTCVFTGPIYVIKLKLKDHPNLGVIDFITTRSELYNHPAFSKSSKKIDPGIWVRDEAWELNNKFRSTGLYMLDYRVYLLAKDAGLTTDYPHSTVDKILYKKLK